MTEERIKELYKDVVDSWKIFKFLLENYEGTEQFMNGASRMLLIDDGQDSPFRTDICWAALSELYREYFKTDPMNEICMLMEQAYRVEKIHGVKVQVRIKTPDGVVREVEKTSA